MILILRVAARRGSHRPPPAPGTADRGTDPADRAAVRATDRQGDEYRRARSWTTRLRMWPRLW